jgi:hypothetical protein
MSIRQLSKEELQKYLASDLAAQKATLTELLIDGDPSFKSLSADEKEERLDNAGEIIWEQALGAGLV